MDGAPEAGHLPPVVTIAALYGAGGTRIGPRVAERLGVQFLDRAIPTRVAERAGVPEAAIAEVDDEPHSRSQRLLGLLGRASPATAASDQVERLDLDERGLQAGIEEFLAHASRAGGVVLGRGGAVVLADVPAALHVHLGGERKARVERVMELQGVDQATAARRVKANDRARRDYVKSTYGIDGDNPRLYHLMIDSTTLDEDVCVELIVAAAQGRTRQPTRKE